MIERLQRDLRAFGVPDLLPPDPVYPQTGQAIAEDPALDGKTLVLEDLVFGEDQVAHSSWVGALGERLADLLPHDEADTRSRVARSLVLVDDASFLALIEHAVPVQARITAALFVVLGDQRAGQYFRDLKANGVKIVDEPMNPFRVFQVDAMSPALPNLQVGAGDMAVEDDQAPRAEKIPPSDHRQRGTRDPLLALTF